MCVSSARLLNRSGVAIIARLMICMQAPTAAQLRDKASEWAREHGAEFVLGSTSVDGVRVDRVEQVSRCYWSYITSVCLSFGPIGQNFTASVTEACARRPGTAASVSRRRRERRILLAGGGMRASRSHTLAASQAFERMHMLFCHRMKT